MHGITPFGDREKNVSFTLWGCQLCLLCAFPRAKPSLMCVTYGVLSIDGISGKRETCCAGRRTTVSLNTDGEGCPCAVFPPKANTQIDGSLSRECVCCSALCKWIESVAGECNKKVLYFFPHISDSLGLAMSLPLSVSLKSSREGFCFERTPFSFPSEGHCSPFSTSVEGSWSTWSHCGTGVWRHVLSFGSQVA